MDSCVTSGYCRMLFFADAYVREERENDITTDKSRLAILAAEDFGEWPARLATALVVLGWCRAHAVCYR